MARNTDPPWELRESEIQGRGLFATRRIRRGTTVIEYLGERISTEEADRRYDDDAMDRTHTFLFTIDDETVIDATYQANEAKYINHSCDPNCETYLDDGRIFIESIRTIDPGEELTYDYKLERGGEVRDEWFARYACNCGTAKCRGTLLAPIKKHRRSANGAFKKRKAS